MAGNDVSLSLFLCARVAPLHLELMANIGFMLVSFGYEYDQYFFPYFSLSIYIITGPSLIRRRFFNYFWYFCPILLNILCDNKYIKNINFFKNRFKNRRNDPFRRVAYFHELPKSGNFVIQLTIFVGYWPHFG